MSLTTRLIARIDIKPSLGAVKGVRLDGLRRIGPAVELAAEYEDQGADELLLIDTTASLYGRPPAWDIIREVAHVATIPVTYCGGVRSIQDALHAMRIGAEKVAINTAALERPEIITDFARKVGSQAVVVSLEAKQQDQGWRCYVEGGRQRTAWDVPSWAAQAWILGAGELLLTSVDRDGTGSGYDIRLIQAVRSRVPEALIVASGGAGDPHDCMAALRAGADAAAVATLLHWGLPVSEIKAAMSAEGVLVR